MATFNEIKELARHAVKRTAPANFSVDQVDKALVDELNGLASSFTQFMKNRYDIFEIIVQAIDEVVPNKVISAVGPFAEVQVVGQGQKAIFKTRVGTERAKKFLTQVGLSGVYETFRLDNTTFEVPVHAIGGACTVDFERMLDGAESMVEVMNLILEAQTDAIFVEVHRALRAAISATARPAANLVISPNFEPDKMMKLISVVRAYGSSAVIFAPPEFIGAMGADAIVPVGASYQGVYSPDDIDAIHRTGYINIFRGTPIVQIPQSFVDTNNEKTQIDPQLAYVLPAGREKVVKVVLEGNTQMWDFVNKDQSMEFDTYRKLGCAILTHYNWGIYQNTGIADTFEDIYSI